jgi:hypothetical protein
MSLGEVQMKKTDKTWATRLLVSAAKWELKSSSTSTDPRISRTIAIIKGKASMMTVSLF